MKVMPIRYVRDVEASTRFYEALGLSTTARQRGGGWVELTGSAGIVALHSSPDGGGAELSLLADEPLEEVVRATAGGRLARFVLLTGVAVLGAIRTRRSTRFARVGSDPPGDPHDAAPPPG